MILASLLASVASAEPLPRAFAEAADEFGVPEPILLALAYEASGWQPDVASQWGGYGLFDLREPGEGGMDVETAAMLLDRSPDDLIDDPIHNIRGAAALLAEAASIGGELPETDDLLAWWGPVTSFSANHAENLQHMYAAYVFDLINTGI
ncbi:MAG: soluble lytic murein transglycosylase-like protein, partial [Myxococcota bacterium]